MSKAISDDSNAISVLTTNPDQQTSINQPMKELPALVQSVKAEYHRSPPGWRSADTGKAYPPKDDPYDFFRVGTAPVEVDGGNDDIFFYEYRINDDGEFLFRTVLSRKKMSPNSYGYYSRNEIADVPKGWDETVAKSTKFFADDRELAEIDFMENRERIQAQWASAVTADLKRLLESQEELYSSAAKVRTAIQSDLETLLSGDSFGDNKTKVKTVDTKGRTEYTDTLRDMIRTEEKPSYLRRHNDAPEGTSFFLVYPTFSRTGVPKVDSLFARSGDPDLLRRTSVNHRNALQRLDEDASQWLDKEIDRATKAFLEFSKTPTATTRSTQLAQHLCRFHPRTSLMSNKEEVLGMFVAAHLQGELEAAGKTNTNDLDPIVSLVRDYTWSEALETGYVDTQYLSGPSSQWAEEIIKEIKYRVPDLNEPPQYEAAIREPGYNPPVQTQEDEISEAPRSEMADGCVSKKSYMTESPSNHTQGRSEQPGALFATSTSDDVFPGRKAGSRRKRSFLTSCFTGH